MLLMSRNFYLWECKPKAERQKLSLNFVELERKWRVV